MHLSATPSSAWVIGERITITENPRPRGTGGNKRETKRRGERLALAGLLLTALTGLLTLLPALAALTTLLAALAWLRIGALLLLAGLLLLPAALLTTLAALLALLAATLILIHWSSVGFTPTENNGAGQAKFPAKRRKSVQSVELTQPQTCLAVDFQSSFSFEPSMVAAIIAGKPSARATIAKAKASIMTHPHVFIAERSGSLTRGSMPKRRLG